MLNTDLMSRWQNWVTIFLMISIALVGFHSFIVFVDKD